MFALPRTGWGQGSNVSYPRYQPRQFSEVETGLAIKRHNDANAHVESFYVLNQWLFIEKSAFVVKWNNTDELAKAR